MFLHYFLVGMRDIFSYGIVRTSLIIIVLVILITIYRRLSICMKSGGKFSPSYNIKDGYFYIHSGIVPGKRKIVIKNIESITVHLIRGPKSNGDRYHILISMRVGRDTSFFVGKSESKEVEIAELRKCLKKNNVKVYYYD